MLTSSLLKKANRLLINEANILLKKHGVTHAYTFFLMALYEQDGLTQSQMHKQIGIEQPTAVRTLDRMERDGLITREQSETDRRYVCIKLTPKAKKYKSAISGCALELNNIALKGFSQKECDTLNHLIARLNLNLEQY